MNSEEGKGSEFILLLPHKADQTQNQIIPRIS